MSNRKVTLDSTDRKILKFLVKNARMPYLEIARECGISGAAIHQRINKLEDWGVIMGSRMMVNPKMLGFDVCAFISIRIQDPIMSTAVAEKIKNIPEVVECHFITGTYNDEGYVEITLVQDQWVEGKDDYESMLASQPWDLEEPYPDTDTPSGSDNSESGWL